MNDELKRGIYENMESKIHMYSDYNKVLRRNIDDVIDGNINLSKKTEDIIEKQRVLREKYQEAQRLLDELEKKSK